MNSLDHSQILNHLVSHRLRDDGAFRQALAYFVAANAQQAIQMHQFMDLGIHLDARGREAIGYMEQNILESFRNVFGFDLKETAQNV
jgi:hypothetical protein